MMPRGCLKDCSAPGVALKFLLILVLVQAIVSLTDMRIVAAQSGNITAFADEAASSCSITDQTIEPFTIYVFHTNFSQMLDVYFRVYESPGFHAIYIGESVNGLVSVGDFRNGIGLLYGVCRDGPMLLGTISYQGNGTSEPCSYVDIVGWRASLPLTGDCNFAEYPAPSLGNLYVNPQPGACEPWCDVVTTEPTTWGKVKALYRG